MSRREQLIKLLSADLNAPSPSEWGPPLWKMLHWLAEQTGKQTSKLLKNDEIESWKRLFRTLKDVIPCAMCKKHYIEYFKTHFNLAKLDTITNESEKYDLIRRWLWELHEHVNMQKKSVTLEATVEDTSVPFESLSEQYSLVNFIEEREKFYEVLIRALRQNIVTRESIISFKNIIISLFGMYRTLGRR